VLAAPVVDEKKAVAALKRTSHVKPAPMAKKARRRRA